MKVLVVGDYIEDRYVFGTASRLCPEAPVPVVVPENEDWRDGGAGLVWAQLRELGIDARNWFGSTSVKERIFCGSHLVCRIDRDSLDEPVTPWWRDEFLNGMEAIVVSDYGKGAMTPALARKLVEAEKMLFVDSKSNFHWYAGSHTIAFPNEHEATGPGPFLQIVKKLGAKGASMDYGVISVPATVTEVVDVTGAGDTFMAGFVWGWSNQLQPEDCLRLANSLAGEACKHLGTYVVPRSFAQAELDRLRASPESARPVPDCSPDSTKSTLRPPLEPGQGFSEWSRKSDSLASDCEVDRATLAGVENNLRRGRTLPESPSIPTVPTGAPTPSDQESSDEQDRRLR